LDETTSSLRGRYSIWHLEKVGADSLDTRECALAGERRLRLVAVRFQLLLVCLLDILNDAFRVGLGVLSLEHGVDALDRDVLDARGVPGRPSLTTASSATLSPCVEVATTA